MILAPAAAGRSDVRAETVKAALEVVADPTLDARRAAAVARATARCMTSRGWVFTAVAEPAPPIPDVDLDPIPWAARWGFGVSTAQLMPSPVNAPDPNLVRIALEPEATRTAFLAALHGRPGSAGCAARAVASVHGSRDRILAPLRGPLATLAASIASDPDLALALAAWRRCVPALDGADAGASAAAGNGLGRGAYGATMVAWFAHRLTATANDPVALADLQAQERQVAVGAARCEAAYADAWRAVGRRHEAPFVDRHRSVLAALGAEIRRVEDGYPRVVAGPP